MVGLVSNTFYVPALSCRTGAPGGLHELISLGNLKYTGLFPSSVDDYVPSGPLTLSWNHNSKLVQLNQIYNPDYLYGDSYGYRSGLNQSMVTHLHQKVAQLETKYHLNPNAAVLDIGSNDATLLNSYSNPSGLYRVGVDPCIPKYSEFYEQSIIQVPSLFSRSSFNPINYPKFSIITSIAMFYDLDDPVDFAIQVHDALAQDGVWHFEQSYLPTMLHTNSFDTICHEHADYYSLTSINNILTLADLKIIDLQFNNINGGSFAVTAARRSSAFDESPLVAYYLSLENSLGFHTADPFVDFFARIQLIASSLCDLLSTLKSKGKTIHVYGASTKGNVLLQFCGLGTSIIDMCAEVNPYKYNRFTPGTNIPIVSEDESLSHAPDYYLVLPWHFRSNILSRAPKARTYKYIFPLPYPEVV
jgi:hypothetical protein